MTRPDRTDVIFLAFGPTLIKAENYYAILCLLHQCTTGGRPGRVIVYTDDPPFFRDLPVEARDITADMRTAAHGGYRNKMKSVVTLDALARAQEAVVFCDGDTYFYRDPARLTEKIGVDAAVMHMPEARLDRTQDERKLALGRAVVGGQVRGPDGDLLQEDTWMWNSGVTGLHVEHAALLTAAVALGDRINAVQPGLRGVEQYSLTQALRASVSVARGAGEVFHYWPRNIRYPFALHLPEMVSNVRALPLEDRALVAWSIRPRYRGVQYLRMKARSMAWAVGVPLKGVPTSV